MKRIKKPDLFIKKKEEVFSPLPNLVIKFITFTFLVPVIFIFGIIN